MKVSEPPIIVEHQYPRKKEVVWSAISDPSAMRQWFFLQIADFKAKLGFETSFTVALEERQFTHQWKVIEVIPFQFLKYSWRYKEYPGDAYVSFELYEENGITRLVLTAVVLEDFPSDIPEFEWESGLRGWRYFLQERLEAYLSSM